MSKLSWNLKNTKLYHNFYFLNAVSIKQKALYKQLTLPHHDGILRFYQILFLQNSPFSSWVDPSKNKLRIPSLWQNCVLSKLTPPKFAFLIENNSQKAMLSRHIFTFHQKFNFFCFGLKKCKQTLKRKFRLVISQPLNKLRM